VLVATFRSHNVRVLRQQLSGISADVLGDTLDREVLPAPVVVGWESELAPRCPVDAVVHLMPRRKRIALIAQTIAR